MVQGAEGVHSVLVDGAAGNLNVVFDPGKTSPEKLAQRIRDRGYTVDRVNLMK